MDGTTRAHLPTTAKILLAILTQHENGSYSCASRHPSDRNRWMIIPHPAFDWDPNVETFPVVYPQYLRMLADAGLLSFDGTTYSVSEAGKAVGRRMHAGKEKPD